MSSISSSTGIVSHPLFATPVLTKVLDDLDTVQDLLAARLTCKKWDEEYPFDKKIPPVWLRMTILNLQVQDPKMWACLNAIMPSIRDNTVYYKDCHRPWQTTEENSNPIKHILLVQCFDENQALQKSWISPLHIYTYCQTKNPLTGGTYRLYLSTSAQGMDLQSEDFRKLRTRGVSVQTHWCDQVTERNIAISVEDLQKIMPAPKSPWSNPLPRTKVTSK